VVFLNNYKNMAYALFSFIVLIFSVIIHEIAHGSVALQQGDYTAKNAGRLTLNPINHIDPIGSILLPLSLFFVTAGRGPIFGWAKPVPVNPYNFKDQRWGVLKVSLAGVLSNFAIAVIFGLMIRFLVLPLQTEIFFEIIVFTNLLLGFFNLVPIPPLTAPTFLFELLPQRAFQIKEFLEQYGRFILIFFIFFGIQYIYPLISIFYRIITGRILI